jgi:hypothetical protein
MELDVSVVGGPHRAEALDPRLLRRVVCADVRKPDFLSLGEVELAGGAGKLPTRSFANQSVPSAVTVTAIVIDPVGRRGEPRRVDAVNVT